MAHDSEHKSAAELQQEIERQRGEIDNTIDQIQRKLSPGQLLDEALAYAKGSGGAEFLNGLQRNVIANPMPVALLGVSLAWLIAKPATDRHPADRAWDDSINHNRGYDGASEDETDYPVTSIAGDSLQRVGTVMEDGRDFSEFTDDSGRKFRAPVDAMGRRAGHFKDEAGNTFRGFTDSAGKSIQQFRDETGNLIDEIGGWASHNWRATRDTMRGTGGAMRYGLGAASDRVGGSAEALRSQAGRLTDTMIMQFRDQPLIAGAVAFAVGAAIGSALPHTEEEDELMGEASDSVKSQLGDKAEDLYEQGRQKAADLYETASSRAGDLYRNARDDLQNGADQT
jgi:hypothetical protein